ncbi:MAG: isochorismatase family protein, partial [Paludibacterium sp.]
MAVTVLDEKTALVLIDLQKGIVALPVAHSAAEVVSRASRLAAAFRRAGKPVALVNVAGGAPGRTDRAAPALPRTSDWTELVAELAAEPSDLRVTKHAWGAFTGTDLHAKLKALGVT